MVVIILSTVVFFVKFQETPQLIKPQKIVMPYDVFVVTAIKEHTKKFTCKKIPDPVVNLKLPAYYDQTDPSRSKIQQDVYNEHQNLREPLRYFDNHLLLMTNLYVEGGMKRQDVVECAISWLYEWASKGAMLGEMNKTGEQVQKWGLAVYTNAYSQVMHSASLQDQQKEVIEAWLKKYADKVKENYSTRMTSASRNNNHLYWAAWGVAITGAVLQDKVLYGWGIDKAVYAVNQIEEDGTLPLEIKRGERALHYHIFALHPLVMLAELARVNGDVDLYAENNGALEMLVSTSVKGLDNPDFFEKRTGVKQDLEYSKTRSALAWMEIYAKTHKNKKIDKYLKRYRPMKQSRTGGNVTMLYSGTEPDY